MIPRIVHPRFTRLEKIAFGRGESARPLRVFVDAETVPDSATLGVLLSLAHHAEVEVIGTDARFANLLRVGAYDATHGLSPWEIDFEGGRRLRSAVPGPDVTRVGRRYAAPGGEERAERAMVMASGAAHHGADALVTTDPLLLEVFPRNMVDSANPMSIADAVALLGLFLRVREDFVIDMGDGWQHAFDRALFYWVLVRDLTPAGWRWFAACVAHSGHANDDALLFFGQSALERIERALRARDRLHEKLQLPVSRDAATEAVFYFDVALFMLGGAFDGLAHVAHTAHGLGGSERAVGWGNRSWMNQLRASNPALAQMMSLGQPYRDARELVAILRNTIHQEALRTITWQSGGTRSERVLIPAGVAVDLERVLTRNGTITDYGVARQADGRLYIDPGIYLEAILPYVFDAVNAVMEATPVERLPGVNVANLLTAPPDDETFNATIRERIRLLGGIG